ncbi:molybdate ABC transporter substrate-binding protein [Calidifontibacillus oryziterrae]|uniref:molybdate ABC transporter substrate-binding protein n=1 Tax=Calidifontibacillus oryziterrae TaxID=1191699 RepID=UPI00030EAFA6|nr:molybdate ABC transporter substrate-binding protein [Calidifontibacillus oryziterrae]
MIQKIHVGLIALLLFVAVIGCSQNKAVEEHTNVGIEQAQHEVQSDVKQIELTISAAISLTDALNEMKDVYEKEHKEVTLTFNLGGSGKLAQQIEQGAPVDIFLSADTKWMDELESKSLVVTNTRVDFTGNKIVLITNKDNELGLNSFKDIDSSTLTHIAVGEPTSVPAGRYTKEALIAIGKWERVQSKLVFGQDVRQVLTYVESGNADMGIVYLSDAVTSDKVTIKAEAQPQWHSAIIYPAAVTAESKNKQEAKKFINFLQGEQGQAILEKYGFVK